MPIPTAAAVVKHFDDFHEDQFDFHAYCVRKVTLRAYTEVLRFEDNLWGEDYYFTAAEGIIRIYLHLHDNPSIMEEDNIIVGLDIGTTKICVITMGDNKSALGRSATRIG